MDKIWIYLNDTQQGPYTVAELLDLPVTVDTPVWFAGQPKWLPVSQVPELAAALGMEGIGRDPETVVETSVVEETVVIEDTGFQPSAPRPSAPVEPCPKTYIGWSIFVTVCCCSPVSIGALVASLCVTSFYNRGNMHAARKASEWAQWLIMIAMAIGFFWSFIISPLL